MPIIYTAKRSSSLPKMKDMRGTETDVGIDEITSGVFDLQATKYGATETSQSKDHSLPVKEIDDKIMQLITTRDSNLNKDEMLSTRWIGFIIFLLFVISTMFLMSMIIIFKNRGKNKRDREILVKRECGDNCPLINYESMRPDNKQRRLSSSSIDVTKSKSQDKSSISSSKRPTVMHMCDENTQAEEPIKSQIIMADKKEQTHKVVKQLKCKAKKAKVKKLMMKKRKYETEQEKVLNKMNKREKITNSSGKDNETCTEEDYFREHEKFNLTKLCLGQHKTLREKRVKRTKERKPNIPLRVGKNQSNKPRLSFPMACANRHSNTERSLIQCENSNLRAF